MLKLVSYLSNDCSLRLIPNVIHKQTYLSICHISSLRIQRFQVDQIARISYSALLCGKSFVEYENNFAHQIMEKNPSYAKTLLTINPCMGTISIQDGDKLESIIGKDFTSESASGVCKAFEMVSLASTKNGYDITDEKFDLLCKSLVSRRAEYTDSELSDILRCLSLWPQTKSLNSRNFNNIWSALDRECVSRIKIWDNEKMLFIADHWYNLHLTRVSDYVWNCARRLGTKLNRLKPSQLVQIMFYMNISRKMNSSISVYEFENRIEQCINDLSINEIAILAMGFFKTQTRIRSANLVAIMLERTTDEVDTINEIALSALVKTFRLSLPLTHTDMLYHLLDRLIPNIPRLSLLCCIHIALAGTNSQLFHEKLLKTISQRFSNEIESLRIKDIERIAFALTLYDYNPNTVPCIYEQIAKELCNPARKEELEKYPKCVTSCLHYLTLKNIYKETLISQTLDQECLIKTYGKNSQIGREILCLDTSVAIECPNYSGNRLTTKQRHSLGKSHTNWIPVETKKKLSATDTMMFEIKRFLEGVLNGSQYVYIGNILPNFQRPDILFGVGDKDTAVEIPANFLEIVTGDTKYPPVAVDNVRWRCVVIGGWNSYIRGSGVPLGSTATKMRQLKLLGYDPVLVRLVQEDAGARISSYFTPQTLTAVISEISI